MVRRRPLAITWQTSVSLLLHPLQWSDMPKTHSHERCRCFTARFERHFYRTSRRLPSGVLTCVSTYTTMASTWSSPTTTRWPDGLEFCWRRMEFCWRRMDFEPSRRRGSLMLRIACQVAVSGNAGCSCHEVCQFEVHHDFSGRAEAALLGYDKQ